MKTIIFVTGNKYKFQVAQKALEKTGIKLVQKDLKTPELQSEDIKEIASFSAQWAANLLKKPVVVTDAGYYIKALNGFPGPFIKWINKWFTAKDYLKLMEGKEDRTVITKDCLAYCEPGKKPITFTGSAKGTIALKPGPPGTTPINEIFIPEGFDKVESAIPKEQMIQFWNKYDKKWQKFASFLKNDKVISPEEGGEQILPRK